MARVSVRRVRNRISVVHKVLRILHRLWYMYFIRCVVGRGPTAPKNPAALLPHTHRQRASAGVAKGMEEGERHAIGQDLLRAQWRWPVGMPLCRSLGNGLWEVRTDLPTGRAARVLLCIFRRHLVALHGFVKKTRTTPDEDLALARRRQKELER